MFALCSNAAGAAGPAQTPSPPSPEETEASPEEVAIAALESASSQLTGVWFAPLHNSPDRARSAV